LLACVLLMFYNSCILAPQLVGTMIRMFQLETGSGIAYKVGFCDRTELKKKPEYSNCYTKFRMYHSLSGVANLVTMGCNLTYMYHLAGLSTNFKSTS